MVGRKSTIRDLFLENRRVLIRVDFNVDVKDNKVVDNRKIRTVVPTVKYVLEQNARSVVLISHLGRPLGRKNEQLSLKPVADELERLLGCKVIFVQDSVGAEAAKACAHPEPGSVFLMENLRFHPEEEGFGTKEDGEKFEVKDKARAAFVSSLSHLADVYVVDCMKGSHREKNASFEVNLPKRAAGLLVADEVARLDNFINSAAEPTIAIIGGKKIEKKLDHLIKIVDLVNEIILVGDFGVYFLKHSQNFSTGKTPILEASLKEKVDELIQSAATHNTRIRLPKDFLVADKLDGDAKDCKSEVKTVAAGFNQEWHIVDIGPESIKEFKEAIKGAKTVLWTGPAGHIKHKNFQKGTKELMDSLVECTKAGGETIVLGDDTVRFVKEQNAEEKVSYVSINSRACLQYLGGRSLRSVDVLVEHSDVKPKVIVEHEKAEEKKVDVKIDPKTGKPIANATAAATPASSAAGAKKENQPATGVGASAKLGGLTVGASVGLGRK